MANPFELRWLDGWIFRTVLIGGQVLVEAHGFGIRLRTPLQQGESPTAAADRLVLQEDRRRRALHNAWRRGQMHSWKATSAVASSLPLHNPAAEAFTPPPTSQELFSIDVPIPADRNTSVSLLI